jgi:hypothetical protein
MKTNVPSCFSSFVAVDKSNFHLMYGRNAANKFQNHFSTNFIALSYSQLCHERNSSAFQLITCDVFYCPGTFSTSLRVWNLAYSLLAFLSHKAISNLHIEAHKNESGQSCTNLVVSTVDITCCLILSIGLLAMIF